MSIDRNQFASDNYAGVCPTAWKAMERANAGFALAYGDDPYTQSAADKLRELFDADCEVFFVFNGTSGNSLALSSLCQSYHSIICHELAHIETDECGAPEFFSNGSKLLLGQGADGRLTPGSVETIVTRRSDIHYPRPRVLSLTQSTEVGTLYRVEELRALREVADRHRLHIHMDGARFANAVASLDVNPGEITAQAGVDVLCFGGTKNGMAVGEAVIFFDRALAEDFEYRCKQAGQLASKMRYVSAPWIGMLETGAWLDNARHANRCAQRLAQGLASIEGVDLLFPCEANAVFVKLAAPMQEHLRARGWRFYTFIGTGGARFMCSWDTSPEAVDQLLQDAREAAAA